MPRIRRSEAVASSWDTFKADHKTAKQLEEFLGNFLIDDLIEKGVEPGDFGAVSRHYAEQLGVKDVSAGKGSPLLSILNVFRPKDDSLTGFFNPSLGQLRVRGDLEPPAEILTLRHEMEHARDAKEGFQGSKHHNDWGNFDVEYPMQRMIEERQSEGQYVHPDFLRRFMGTK